MIKPIPAPGILDRLAARRLTPSLIPDWYDSSRIETIAVLIPDPPDGPCRKVVPESREECDMIWTEWPFAFWYHGLDLRDM